MLRRAQERVARPGLDDLAGVHDRHLLRHLRDHAQVVGDEQQRHAALGLQAPQHLEDLRLDRDVELKKVVWPTRKETVQTTAAVFAFVVVMALFLWVSDKTLEWVLYDLILGWKKT